MKDTIQHTNIRTDENEAYLSDPERKLSFAQRQRMQCLCGEGSSTAAENAVLTAPYSETRVTIDPASLYAKRMKLLIESGLVAGIIPTSTRKQSPQQTLDFAFFKLDGDDSNEKPDQD